MNKSSSSSSIGFLSLLALLFIALKLMSFIDWDWWVVLLPLYAPFGVVMVVLIVGVVWAYRGK